MGGRPICGSDVGAFGGGDEEGEDDASRGVKRGGTRLGRITFAAKGLTFPKGGVTCGSPAKGTKFTNEENTYQSQRSIFFC